MSSSQKSVTLACKTRKFNLTVFVSSTFRNVCPKTKQFWNSALCDVTKGTRGPFVAALFRSLSKHVQATLCFNRKPKVFVRQAVNTGLSRPGSSGC